MDKINLRKGMSDLDIKYNRKSEGVDKSFTQLFLLGVLIVMVIFLSLSSPFFFTWNNIRNILDHCSIQLILAIGMTFVISTGGIDLSIGSIVALSGIVMGLTLQNGSSSGISAVLGVLTGAILGTINGVIISNFEIAPFILTIGSMSLYRGVALVITGGMPIYDFPPEFTYFGKGDIGKINLPIMLAIIITTIAVFLLRYTKWGKYTLVLGGNEESLRRVGVSVKLYKITVYMFLGFTAGLAALIMTSRLNAAEPNAGFMLESDIIAAVILGGTSMTGGRASISGTVISCLLLTIMRNGLTIMGVSSYYQQLFVGTIIIVSVLISEIRKRKLIQIQ